MKDKPKSKLRTLTISIAVFCVLYIILALRPLGTELHLSPEWTEDISRIKEVSEDDVLLPFKTGKRIGYFTPDGKIASSMNYDFQASIDADFYASYTADSRAFTVFDHKGEEVVTIQECGFPYFEDDRIYVFLPGGTSFERFDRDGTRLYRYEGYSPITAFASCDSATVVGLADGTIISLDNDGLIDQQFAPGGSSTEIIMGLAVSDDGELIAAVCGQNEQRVIVAQKNGEHCKIIFHEYLGGDLKEQVKLAFNSAKDTVYYNYKGGIGIVDLVKMKSSHIKVDGTVTQFVEYSDPHLEFALSHDGYDYRITIIEPFDNNAGSFDFKAETAFIQVYGDGVFIGRNNKISRLTVSRR